MEVGEVKVYDRQVTTYSIRVECSGKAILLNVDEQGWARIKSRYYEDPTIGSTLAEFRIGDLRPVHAAIGAVLEAMGEEGE